MPSQKLEDMLNLSLESTEGQRQRSGVLNVGFDAIERTWELIVKYSGSLERFAAFGAVVETLLAGYAIVTLPEALIGELVAAPEVEFVEMPKNLLNGLYEAKRASCILPLTGTGVSGSTAVSGMGPLLEGERTAGQQGAAAGNGPVQGQGAAAGNGPTGGLLSGSGVFVAVLDSGIDYYMPDFRNPDGSSRIAWLWDQTLDAEELNERQPGMLYAPPEGFALGVEFSKEQLDRALQTGNRDSAFSFVPSLDRSGHGTAVAAIAAGRNPDPLLTGVAFGAQLLVVKLANLQNGFPHTTELMRAVTWAIRKAQQMKIPVSVNISFGTTYGPHDGSSLLSRFLDNAAESWKTVLCVGSGNEGASSGHASGLLTDRSVQIVELAVAEYQRALSIQLWKNFADDFTVTLSTPSGQEILVQFSQTGGQEVLAGENEILIYTGQPSPFSVQQELFFDLLPRNAYLEPGIWSFRLEAKKIVSGEYQLYLPGQEVRNAGTRFVRPSAGLTLTIPATARKVLTVGAYQTELEAYADFSGRGLPVSRENETVFADTKPDIAAPGVNLLVPQAGGGSQRVSGTSFATPIATGTAALLMEWGIVQGNSVYLYGEKMKAYLRRGAKPLRGEPVYPNEKVGYGALCASGARPAPAEAGA